MLRRYRLMDLRYIIATAPGELHGFPVPVQSEGLPYAEVAIPAIEFGQVSRPAEVIQEWPEGTWSAPSYSCPHVDRFTLFGAVIHGEQGVISIGDIVIRESLYHVHLAATGFTRIDDNTLELEEPEIALEVADATYSMCGFVANRNYAHWWIDVASTLQIPPFGDDVRGSVVVMPKLRAPFQLGSLDLLVEAKRRAVFIGEQTRVSCQRLTYMPQIVSSDPNPHPARRLLLEEVRRRAGAPLVATRKIYVSRKDATKRRLANEDEVIEILEREGFEPIIMSGMSVAQQVQLFASATHVVGAHGAGLGNVIFCQPGARLLEFHMVDNLIWSIRRMAGLAQMRYGCVFGTTDHAEEPLDTRGWTMPALALKRALKDFCKQDDVVQQQEMVGA